MADILEPEDDADVDGVAGPISPAAAMALGIRKGRTGKAPDPEFDAFLRQQTDLVRIQKEHLHEQRELTLSHMRWRRFSERMKAVLQVMTAVVGLAVVLGMGAMAWSASQERGLVIEPFSVPPDLAARGITGQVIAAKMQDRLSAMQDATSSARAPSTFANNWNDDIKVEIPETGVSVGELHRLLVSWLGHQTRVSGEVYRTSSGIELSARVGAAAARSRSGGDADLDAMIAGAAEDLYAQTQPYRYAVWVRSSLEPQAMVRARELFAQAAAGARDRTDRIWTLNGLGNTYRDSGDFSAAIQTFETGIQLEPRFGTFHANLAQAQNDIGHREAALAEERAALAAGLSYSREFMTPEAAAWYPHRWSAKLSDDLGDFAGAARDMAVIQGQIDPFSSRTYLVELLAHDHDQAAADAASALIVAPAVDDHAQVATERRRLMAKAAAAMALEHEDWRGLKQILTSVDPTKFVPESRSDWQVLETPRLALAMARLGDFPGAQTLIATTAADCYDCVLMRARVAAIAGDWPDAERWFAEAARQGPSLPFAYAEWGRALLDRGDAAGAIAKLQIAHQMGPNFADPLETWGEALMAQRDWAGAAAKFAEADKDAPKWGRNHLLWGEALMLAGRYREARVQFEAANGLDLSRADRAALAVLLDRTAKGPLHGSGTA